MSMDPDLESIAKRVDKLEGIANARLFVLEAVLNILSVKFPEAYAGTVDGMDEGLKGLGLEFDDGIMAQEIRHLLRVRPIQK